MGLGCSDPHAGDERLGRLADGGGTSGQVVKVGLGDVCPRGGDRLAHGRNATGTSGHILSSIAGARPPSLLLLDDEEAVAVAVAPRTATAARQRGEGVVDSGRPVP